MMKKREEGGWQSLYVPLVVSSSPKSKGKTSPNKMEEEDPWRRKGLAAVHLWQRE
jgi:hypothetical protein